MFHSFRLYDLFILSFVQLLVSTVLVLSPLRDLDPRSRWTGSRVTEVLLGALGAAVIAGISCFLTFVLWGLPLEGLESAAYVLVICSVVVIVLRPDTSVIGKVFYASYAAAGFTFLGFAALVAVAATHSIVEALTASLLILLDLGAFLVWNSNINYVSDVLCRTRRSRPLPQADPTYQPMVSLHIPAYNEPPEILIETIKAVERMDYPNFEIVVIDNNTTDPAVYGPVEEYCRGRERVRFVHVAPWPGYKAGACNLALRSYTDPRAEVIGMIDADDIVKPYYLRETAPYFSDPNIGFVQTCEGNRDYEGSAYYTACVDSYQGFYLAVMSSRNERDTVPFVGTMGLFRTSALVGIGGWNEWCISEDTEASLRVLKAGWSGVYIPRCFGRGIVPPTFAGLNTQRHRWCFGAMQIMRLHWRSLLPWDRSPDNHLTASQRRDYLMASLGWFRDLMMLGFALVLLVVTGLVLSGSSFALMPLGGNRSLMPMSLIIIATICMTWTLRHWIPDHPSSGGSRPSHQPLRQLDHRAGVHTGNGASRGRVPPHVQDRLYPPSAAYGVPVEPCRDAAGGHAVHVGRSAHRLGPSPPAADRHHLATRNGVSVLPDSGVVEPPGPARPRRGVPAALRGPPSPPGEPAAVAALRHRRLRARHPGCGPERRGDCVFRRPGEARTGAGGYAHPGPRDRPRPSPHQSDAGRRELIR